jgi:hypothetical protein
MVQSWFGEPTPQRAGRAKRVVRVTAKEPKAGDFYSAILKVSCGFLRGSSGIEFDDEQNFMVAGCAGRTSLEPP